METELGTQLEAMVRALTETGLIKRVDGECFLTFMDETPTRWFDVKAYKVGALIRMDIALKT